MNRQLRVVLGAGVAAAISIVLAACGSPGEGGPTAQFGVPIVTVIGAQPGSLAFGDVDRDGKLDIVLRSGEGPLYGQGTLLLLRGNGDGTFKPAEQIPGLTGAAGVAMGDLDRDGNLDLAVTGCLTAPCAPGALALFTMAGKGDGTFSAPVALPTQYPIAQSVPLIVDLNVDGWPDVAVLWSRPTFPIFTEWKEIAIFLGTATGMTPAPGLTVSLGPLKPGHIVGISATDVDRDGKPDLIDYFSSIDGGGGAVTVRLGRGDGTFMGGGSAYAHCVLAGRYTFADFNDDGKLDLVIGMGDLCIAPMNLYLGIGDGTFGPATPIDVQAPDDAWLSQTPVIAGDLDGDGHQDIVVRWTDTSAVSLLYGNGDGTFRGADQYPLDVSGGIASLVDLNGDGRPDLVLVGANGIVAMLNTR